MGSYMAELCSNNSKARLTLSLSLCLCSFMKGLSQNVSEVESASLAEGALVQRWREPFGGRCFSRHGRLLELRDDIESLREARAGPKTIRI